MTQEQFRDIQEKLRVLREYRCLSVEGQRKNFKIDYTKKLLKFFEAERDNNEYGMIKSLCDMIVICVNAGMEFCDDRLRLKRDFYSSGVRLNLAMPILWSPFEDNIVAIEAKGYNPYKCLLETIKELNSRTGAWSEEEGKWVKDEGAYTIEEAREKAGFNYINKLSKGAKHWYVLGGNSVDDDLVQKSFVRWYKADYASCKLESVE